uniref:Uncharacterized protein n=1 Tax=Bionectria ochroleuca TaxID=29856 RepID=A0A0B7KSG7_BIOOC
MYGYERPHFGIDPDLEIYPESHTGLFQTNSATALEDLLITYRSRLEANQQEVKGSKFQSNLMSPNLHCQYPHYPQYSSG